MTRGVYVTDNARNTVGSLDGVKVAEKSMVTPGELKVPLPSGSEDHVLQVLVQASDPGEVGFNAPVWVEASR